MTKRKPSKPQPLKKVAQHYTKASQTFMLELYRRAIAQAKKEEKQ